MDDHDISYFKGTAKKTGNDYDYKHWTDDVFSR